MTTTKNTLTTNQYQPRRNRQRLASLVMALAIPLTISSAFAQYKNMPMDDVNQQNPEFTTIFNIAPKSVLKGATKIAIPLFTIETATKTGLGIRVESSGGSVSQSVTYILDGVPQKAMQAAVDALYDELVADLKTAGIEVIPYEQLMATAAYKKNVTALTSPSIQSGHGAEALVYSAKGMTPGLSNSRFIFTRTTSVGSSNAIDGLLAAAKTVSQLSSQIGDAGVAAAIGEELGVPVLLVQIPVEFVEQKTKGSGGFFSSATTAEVSSRLRLSIAPNTFVSAGQGNDFSGLMSTTSLTLTGTPVKDVKDTSSVAANVGLAVFAMALGAKTSTRLTEKTAIADPEKYVESIRTGVGKFVKVVGAAVKAMQ